MKLIHGAWQPMLAFFQIAMAVIMNVVNLKCCEPHMMCLTWCASHDAPHMMRLTLNQWVIGIIFSSTKIWCISMFPLSGQQCLCLWLDDFCRPFIKWSYRNDCSTIPAFCIIQVPLYILLFHVASVKSGMPYHQWSAWYNIQICNQALYSCTPNTKWCSCSWV